MSILSSTAKVIGYGVLGIVATAGAMAAARHFGLLPETEADAVPGTVGLAEAAEKSVDTAVTDLANSGQ